MGGASAYQLFGARREVAATLDYWNDRDDVYGVYLRAGERLVVSADATTAVSPVVELWRPGTQPVAGAASRTRRLAIRPPGGALRYRAAATGWYVLQVRIARPGSGAYRLVVAKSR